MDTRKYILEISTAKLADNNKYVTFYHGTGSKFVPSIKRNGIRGMDFKDELEKIIELGKKHGVPEYAITNTRGWGSTVSLRSSSDKIGAGFRDRKFAEWPYVTTSYDAAALYAKVAGAKNGEFMRDLTQNLYSLNPRFANELRDLNKPTSPVVAVIRYPYDKLASSYKTLIPEMIAGQQNNDLRRMDIQVQNIDPKYIVKFNRV